MFAKPTSSVLLLAAFLQAAVGSFALSTESPSTGLSRRQGSSSTTTVTEIKTFTAQWSQVSTAFDTCHQTFQSQSTSVEVAVQSVTTLHQTCDRVARQYPSCRNCAGAVQSASQEVTTFKSHIEHSFTTFQEILKTGKARFASDWQSKFAASFRQFDGFVKSANTACSSLNLQLDVIIKGLGLDLNLFVGVSLNLGGLLGAVGSLLGGILRKREVLLLN
ncbi:uncharacterized protein PGTG_15174 [Puccinia graminis f. sp. tritici CRL 75-36-700-3]|uniref:Uncharacterized protein n=1 Tax=Puccinia graminis f. sp. tritici (strain CRL 75-36-700-3 / race SCCL) TaxID=418459 RepID=E3KX98_PUCGT|nr:uncharacterized protein PGTG_15174 [Puccinia graminis f. sp. tritici CRL 75-36-700-3]EFP88971.1 hypothetical protein PGTG_15174 [Puccinia graminis f. sp. tritici CRL 75-36-700-3]